MFDPQNPHQKVRDGDTRWERERERQSDPHGSLAGQPGLFGELKVSDSQAVVVHTFNPSQRDDSVDKGFCWTGSVPETRVVEGENWSPLVPTHCLNLYFPSIAAIFVFIHQSNF